MPSNKASRYLLHIVENAESIFRYSEGMDFTQFKEDRKTYDAVERCLQRITEAAIRLGDYGRSVDSVGAVATDTRLWKPPTPQL